MAPTRSIIGFLTPKNFSAVFSNNLTKTPCRFLHKCNRCQNFLGGPAIAIASLAHNKFNCTFGMLLLHHRLLFILFVTPVALFFQNISLSQQLNV